jgi:hypothetical protein
MFGFAHSTRTAKISCRPDPLLGGRAMPISILLANSDSQPNTERFYAVTVLGPQLVTAASIETHGEHLAFLRSGGELSALFLFEVAKDWQELTGQASRE